MLLLFLFDSDYGTLLSVFLFLLTDYGRGSFKKGVKVNFFSQIFSVVILIICFTVIGYAVSIRIIVIRIVIIGYAVTGIVIV